MTDAADLFSDVSSEVFSDQSPRGARGDVRRRGGPRTAEGKARSSRNAVRHGLNCPPAYDPDEEAQTAACADWFADGDPRLLEPARAAAEAWAWLKRIRAVRAERVWAPLCRLPESIEEFDPEVMHQAVRELQAIDRYERRARAAYHRSLEELDAARLRLVRAPDKPQASAPPRVRDPAERKAWWEIDDPHRSIARCLAESGYVVGGGIRDWLGRGWVWEWELPAEEGAERTAPISTDRHPGQAAHPRGADPGPSSSALDEGLRSVALAKEGRAATSAALAGSRIGAADAAPSGMTDSGGERPAAEPAKRTSADPPRPPRPTLTAEQRERFRTHLAELAKRTDLRRRPGP